MRTEIRFDLTPWDDGVVDLVCIEETYDKDGKKYEYPIFEADFESEEEAMAFVDAFRSAKIEFHPMKCREEIMSWEQEWV